MAKRTNTTLALPQLKPASLRTFHKALNGWYEAHGRHALPWRQTDDAYKIWLSEVMLQQTQVSTVLARFYPPFLERFPTLESLADAPREKVMKAWEGLGYYTRAANLHKTAISVVENARVNHLNKATMPNDFDALLALPGIGRNTAHAVLAFAYHQPVAIMEANVKRIVARVFALAIPTDDQLWSGAEQLLDSKNPFHHNQAMMDLGSIVCTPKNPACMICPANSLCEGKIAPENYPQKKIKKQVPTREMIITVLQNTEGKYYLTTRADRLLGGLYGFPQTPLSSDHSDEPRSQRRAAAHASGSVGVTPPPTPIGKITHVYSHFKLIGHVVLESASTAPKKEWYSRQEIAALPLSKADHKVLTLLAENEGKPSVPPAQKRHTDKKKKPKFRGHDAT